MARRTVSVSEVARRAGLSDDAVYILLSRGHLQRADASGLAEEEVVLFSALVRAGLPGPVSARLSRSGRVTLRDDGSVVITPLPFEERPDRRAMRRSKAAEQG